MVALVLAGVVLVVIVFSVICIVSAILDMSDQQNAIRKKRKELRRRKIKLSESED